jgi:hypothetical protein
MDNSEWGDVGRRLAEPFDPAEVDWRVQGKVNEQTGKGSVVAYIDARSVQDRLDTVVGAGNWSFDWEPVVVANGEVQVAKGTLTIYGVSKSDAGSASNFEQTLGAVSHCFKRAAVHWGVGRYLYNVSAQWVAVEKGGRLSEQTLTQLRARLPKPSGASHEPRQQQRMETKTETKTTSNQGNHQAADVFPARESEPEEAPAVDPNFLPLVGDENYWQSLVFGDGQAELTALLRRKGYTQLSEVTAYFNALTHSEDYRDHAVAQLAQGKAKWLTRAIQKAALDDLNKRKDVKQPA